MNRTVSQKEFEVKDHLGNVRLVFSDQKDVNIGTTTRYRYNLDVRAVNNYYPFGMLMPDMSWQTSGYRYGFGSHENDNDVKGEGNHSSFGDYGYDPRVGRRLMIEPMIAKYPSLSPYVAYADNPILFTDPDGKEVYILGLDGSDAVEALKTKTSLGIIYDPVKQSVIFVGVPLTLYDVILLKMSMSSKIKVYLQTVKEETVLTLENRELNIIVGGFDGNYISEDGSYYSAIQYINMDHSKKIESGGLSTQGTDVLHELLEAYIFAELYPNTGANKNKLKWLESHLLAMLLDPEAEELGHAYDYYNKTNSYELVMYDVSNPNVTVKIRDVSIDEYEKQLKISHPYKRLLNIYKPTIIQPKEIKYFDSPIEPDPKRKDDEK